MRVPILVALLMGSASPVQAAESVKLAFDDLPKLVLERNQHVSAGQGLVEAAERTTGYLGRSFLPKLTLEAGGESFRTGPFDSMSQPFAGASLTLNLFRGGRDGLEERLRLVQANQAQARYEDTRLEELSKARREFWVLISLREVTQVLKTAIEQNEKNRASARRRVAAGLGSEADRYEFEVFQLSLEQDLARTRLAEANATRVLNTLLGLANDVKLDTPERAVHQHDDQIFRATLDASKHRDVKIARLGGESAELRGSQLKRWWTPSVDLYGGYALHTFREREYLERSDRREGVAGARLSFELFDGLQAQAEGSSEATRGEALRQQAAQTARELVARFESAKQELILNHDLVHGAEKNVELFQKYLAGTLSEYARGQKNSLDVFGASVRYVDLQRRLVEMKRDYELARVELLSILGR